jgi:tetratricopeptide (TPR) repeat protein
MRRLLTTSMLVVASVAAFAQATPTRIAGVSEPGELTGEPKLVVDLTPAEQEFLGKARRSLDVRDATKLRGAIDALTELVQQEPDYCPAYVERAQARCFLDGSDATATLNDLATAISIRSTPQYDSPYPPLPYLYSFRAKVEFDAGAYREAMDDLDAAITHDYGGAQDVFDSAGFEPDTSAQRCRWSQSDLEALVRRFPGDYRAYVYRGLYVSYFVRFDDQYYQPALQDFDAAGRLNPKSPLPHYFAGSLNTRDDGVFHRALTECLGPQTPVPCAIVDERRRKAITASTNALAADARFTPALARRAEAFYGLKRFREAIRDYDRLLALDRSNDAAYNGRGLAKLALGDYASAVVDFDESVGHRKPDVDFWTLPRTFDNRADAYLKMGDYRNAIADITVSLQELAEIVLLRNISQFRAIYPEYIGVSDDALSHKLYALFAPDLSYEYFVQNFLRNHGEWASSRFVPDLYVKRGDAYLGLNDFRRATAEYDRALNGFPDARSRFTPWRPVGSGRGGDQLLDVTRIEFPRNGIGRLRMKETTARTTYTIRDYEIDCRRRRLNQVSSRVYDFHDTLVRSTDVEGGWRPIAPQTVSEQLYNGLCGSR